MTGSSPKNITQLLNVTNVVLGRNILVTFRNKQITSQTTGENDNQESIVNPYQFVNRVQPLNKSTY